MIINKDTKFSIEIDGKIQSVTLSQEMWSLGVGSMFRDNFYGCLKVVEMYDQSRPIYGLFKTVQITWEEVNEKIKNSTVRV